MKGNLFTEKFLFLFFKNVHYEKTGKKMKNHIYEKKVTWLAGCWPLLKRLNISKASHWPPASLLPPLQSCPPSSHQINDLLRTYTACITPLPHTPMASHDPYNKTSTLCSAYNPCVICLPSFILPLHALLQSTHRHSHPGSML